MWERRTEEFAFAHSTTLQDAIGCTPFELGHGTAARTLVSGDALGVSSLDNISAVIQTTRTCAVTTDV